MKRKFLFTGLLIFCVAGSAYSQCSTMVPGYINVGGPLEVCAPLPVSLRLLFDNATPGTAYQVDWGDGTLNTYSQSAGNFDASLNKYFTNIGHTYSTGTLCDYEIIVPGESAILLSLRGKGSMGLEDLYVIRKDNLGKWQKQISLGSVINTSGFETSPFLLEDKKTLFFSSDRPGGFGDADIYCSTRLDDSWQRWSTPVNLGKLINSNHFDAYLSVTRTGEMFFSSNKDANLSDIYRAVKKERKPESKPVQKIDSVVSIPEPIAVEKIHRVVVGAFEFQQNAEKFASRLNNAHLQAALFYEESRRLYYVYVYTSRSLDDARTSRNAFRSTDNKDLWDAWVYSRDAN